MAADPSRKTGASFARGQSDQTYRTPRDFLDAVEARFGPLDFDLAATSDNSVAPRFFGPPGVEYTTLRVMPTREGIDSLRQDWSALAGNLWLNPPFDRIEPWARKCAETALAWRRLRIERRPRIYFLVPAAVGSNWFAAHVHDKALVRFLNGRLCFDGKAPYPKDCLLAQYGAALGDCGYEVWRWKGRG